MSGLLDGGTAVALAALMSLLLYIHFRWAELDPHNPLGRPGRLFTSIKSAAIMMAIFIAVGLMNDAMEVQSAFIGSFAFGVVGAPAFSTPLAMRTDEEPNQLVRLGRSIAAAAGGSLAKAVLVFVVAALATAWTGQDMTYWVVAFLACLFSFSKLGVALALAGPGSSLAPDYAESGLANKVVVVALMAVVSLAAWYSMALPLFETIPAMNWRNFIGAIAFWLGLTLGAPLRWGS